MNCQERNTNMWFGIFTLGMGYYYLV